MALDLIERLIETIDLREAVNRDVRAPMLDEEIRTLEHQLTCVVQATMGWPLERYDDDPTRPRRADV